MLHSQTTNNPAIARSAAFVNQSITPKGHALKNCAHHATTSSLLIIPRYMVAGTARITATLATRAKTDSLFQILIVEIVISHISTVQRRSRQRRQSGITHDSIRQYAGEAKKVPGLFFLNDPGTFFGVSLPHLKSQFSSSSLIHGVVQTGSGEPSRGIPRRQAIFLGLINFILRLFYDLCRRGSDTLVAYLA